MRSTSSTSSAGDALRGIFRLHLAAFIIATLYFAREVLVPIALAILLAFLLWPMVTRLQHWIGRVAAVIVVVVLIFLGLGAGGWVFSRQLMDLADKLPDYKVNLETKLRSLRPPGESSLHRLSETLTDLEKQLPVSKSAASTSGTPKGAAQETAGHEIPGNAQFGPERPMPVQLVEPAADLSVMIAKFMVGPMMGPLGVGGLVLLLVFCLLFQREDLRARFIRLAGQGQIGATTRAMDDAGDRLARYLLMQLVINITYGILIAIGLYFLHIPNAFLWGALATVLRFIPYVGAWIAAVCPMLLALAISPSWWTPVITLALFIGLELIVGNVMEPLLYGSSTGVSSTALIVAAVFWAWLWGPVGLVLAAPMTVCLVVIGRHVRGFSFLSVLLSDEKAFTPAEEFYHRLLAEGLNEASEITDAYLKKESENGALTDLFDEVLLPVVETAEADRQRGELDEDQYDSVLENLRDILEELGSRPPPEKLKGDGTKSLRLHSNVNVLCVPARGVRDELAGAMLAQLLRNEGFQVENVGADVLTGELPALVESSSPLVVCASVVPPTTIVHARYLCAKLKTHFPHLRLIVGLWGAEGKAAESAVERLREAGADEVTFHLGEAVTHVRQIADYAPEEEITGDAVVGTAEAAEQRREEETGPAKAASANPATEVS